MVESNIIITNNSNKRKILKKLSENKLLYNLKFLTFSELKKKLFFDYNNKTLEYVMMTYGVNLNVASKYLDNLYFLKNINDEKVKFLIKLKEELESKNLLIKNESFKNYIKNKKIVIYGYHKLTREQELIVESLEADIEFQNKEAKKYVPSVYEARDINEEVEFVAIKISELLHKNVDITKIKLICKTEYNTILKRYFGIYNIPINFKSDNYFYSTMLASEFLAGFESKDIQDNIDFLREKYDNVNDLVTIINKSVLIEDKNIRKEFIIDDLKRTSVKVDKYDKAVSIARIDTNFNDDEYVFLLGFNINSYPSISKDEDFLSDEAKDKLGLDTSILKNIYQKEEIKKQITSIKNLTITYKLKSNSGVFYPTSIISEENLKVLPIKFNPKITYSKLSSKLKYARDLDNLYKFNMISEELGLYRNNLNIGYREYNNEFKGVNETVLKEKLNHELVLAYTSLEAYNECAFKYYLSKILNLNIYEENFKTIIGNVMHHILEIGLDSDIDINVEIIKYIKEHDYVLTKKEFFYLEKLAKELKEVIAVIKSQASHSKLNKYNFERELYVYKDRDDVRITFKGLIDKVMYEKIDGKLVLAVVDYKTGDALVTLDNLKYGLNMQLPIYLYLLKKSNDFKDAIIAGFYIQKVLGKVPLINDKKTIQDIRHDDMRLQGYSNRDSNILELIDDEYMEERILKNLKFNKDGSISSKSKVLSASEMEELAIVVDEKIDEVIDNILAGNFAINPKVINNKNNACLYCKFKDICFRSKKDEVVLGGDDDEMDGGTVGSYK